MMYELTNYNVMLRIILHKKNPNFEILNDTLLSLGFHKFETARSSFLYDFEISDLRFYDFFTRQIDKISENNDENKEVYIMLKSILHDAKAKHIVRVNNAIHSFKISLKDETIIQIKGEDLTFLKDVLLKICMILLRHSIVFKCDNHVRKNDFGLYEFNIELSEKEKDKVKEVLGKIKEVLGKDEVKNEIEEIIVNTKLQSKETAQLFVNKLLNF
ncbi:MAG: hypothetical protein QXW71_06170 [Thermoplasmata archaeon]